jgi:small GTP-binding protein
MEQVPTHKIKAVLIGDSGVGKSCIYSRLETGTYDEEHLPTIGGSYAKIQLEDRDTVYEVGLFDTAGQERYKAVIPLYFDRADFLIAVYAVNDRDSFTHLTDWLTTARNKASEAVKVFIVGNKCDLVNEKMVAIDELMRFADSVGAVLGIEVSAKTSAGLELLLQAIAQEWTKSLKDGGKPLTDRQKVAGPDIAYRPSRKQRCPC